MVNLKFNPKNTKNGEYCIPSKLSKKCELSATTNLNPFRQLNLDDSMEYSNESGIMSTENTKLIGLDNYYYLLNNWFNNSISTITTKFMLLIGPTGCGKTTLIHNFVKDKGIEVFSTWNITNDSIKSKKDLLKDIIYFTEFNNSFGSYSGINGNNSKKLIFIDEYSNSTSDLLSISDINYLYELRSNYGKLDPKNNKTLINDLVNLFGVEWNILKNVKIPPIIIISSDSRGTRLSDLKKTTELSYISNIPGNIIKKWLLSNNELFPVLGNKYQILKNNQEKLDIIINRSNSDIRFILNTIEFIGNNTNTFELVHSLYKNDDVNIFDFINRIFDNVDLIDIDELFKIYDTDGYLLSNLVQENYLDFSDCMDSIANSADAISYGDVVLNDLYDSNKVFNTEIHCIYSIYIPSFFSKSNVKKNKCPLRTSVLNNRYNIYLNNKKVIDKLNLGEYCIRDIFLILFIKKFINYELIKNKTIKDSELDYLQNLLSIFETDKIEKLELIYKSFNEFKDLTKKTKSFTIKFKEKLSKLIIPSIHNRDSD
jgi:DNA polymerase III delta prime subunit